MNKLEEISAGKKEAPAAGEGATPEGSGEVAAAEAKAADTREAVAAQIDVDKPLSGSTATASQIAAPEGLPPTSLFCAPSFPLHPAVNDDAAALACADQRSGSSASTQDCGTLSRRSGSEVGNAGPTQNSKVPRRFPAYLPLI